MAELVDAPVLGTGFARSEGSSPFIRIWAYFDKEYPSQLAGVLYLYVSFWLKLSAMITIIKFLRSLVIPDPIAPEVIRAKAYEMWKAQGGGTINPDANWQAVIDQLELAKIAQRAKNVLLHFKLLLD